MEAIPLDPGDRQLVQSYRAGGFTVSGLAWVGSILVTPEQTLAWAPTAAAEITVASLEELRAAVPPVELLLVGTGSRMTLLPPALRQELRRWGIVAEPMATPAACRTYNVLLGDGRRVAAALLAL